MIRAVLDTTVLISAFLRPGGLADQLLTLAGEDAYEMVLSSAIILEAWRKLLSGSHIRARYSYSDESALQFCRGLLRIAEVLGDPPAISGAVRDPGDDMIIACALAGKADTIVSRDKDLLSLETFRDILIVSPEAFRKQLRGRASL